MSAHTPAPWEWSGRWLCGKGKMILWYTTNDDGIHVKPEDARLIAAAPELLEALRAQIAAFDGDTFDEIEDEYGLGTAQRIFVAREAIAKATGEQP